jgi:hypothetical protein
MNIENKMIREYAISNKLLQIAKFITPSAVRKYITENGWVLERDNYIEDQYTDCKVLSSIYYNGCSEVIIPNEECEYYPFWIRNIIRDVAKVLNYTPLEVAVFMAHIFDDNRCEGCDIKRRTIEGQKIINAASTELGNAAQEGTCKEVIYKKFDKELRDNLSSLDGFWLRWRFIGEKEGWL